jgi:hypothetical protein
MTFWERIKCDLFGKCHIGSRKHSEVLIEKLSKSVDDTKQITKEMKEFRKSGNWIEDMARGEYRGSRQR